MPIFAPVQANRTSGVFINATDVTLIGLIIQNYDRGIYLNGSGSSNFRAYDNTIQLNGVGVFNENSVPNVDIHYNIFQGNLGYAIFNKGGSQDIWAQYNYWGCAEGPVVDRLTTTTDGGGPNAIVTYHHEYYQWQYSGGTGSALVGFDPATSGCEVLSGDQEPNHWNNGAAANKWTPYKINLEPTAPLACDDPNANNAWGAG